MTDITTATFDEMEAMYDGLARRTRATLNVTAWGMQLFTLPPNWDGYPMHTHGPDDSDPDQEEVYIPLEGGGTLTTGDAAVELRPGMMVRVGPTQPRRILPGDDWHPLPRDLRAHGSSHIRTATSTSCPRATTRPPRRRRAS